MRGEKERKTLDNVIRNIERLIPIGLDVEEFSRLKKR